jgi:hypothetical protein
VLLNFNALDSLAAQEQNENIARRGRSLAMSDKYEPIGPYSQYSDYMTEAEYDRMKARAPEVAAKLDKAEEAWNAFVATASDEEIVRAYLASRVILWQKLPYDWMEMDAEELDEMNLLDYSDEVEKAYQRSRANPVQRAVFERDYDRGEDLTEWYLANLHQRHGKKPPKLSIVNN